MPYRFNTKLTTNILIPQLEPSIASQLILKAAYQAEISTGKPPVSRRLTKKQIPPMEQERLISFCVNNSIIQ